MEDQLKSCKEVFPCVYRRFIYDINPIIRYEQPCDAICFRMSGTAAYDDLYIPETLCDLFSHIFYHVRGLDTQHMLSHTADFYTAIVKFGYCIDYTKALYSQKLYRPSFLVFLVEDFKMNLNYRVVGLTELEHWLRTGASDYKRFALI